ncbi:energy-coupling factor transporter transmembrane component T family protein [Salinicoccus hispanicus]|uniref:Energy-coupling factor transporter transmembrane protein EcfT n=1 Tax=Salinicoccus hispanicus TaxID=157225 RepID=A0A6N8TVH2_9STAP|nr:energy-coupling factor transporter transmembrane component T [Salinicoccus hispanicus]MXQ49918.1 energy-coupling factor transporter transmembrane protein EcfT [Salinicoccus hispanicus]
MLEAIRHYSTPADQVNPLTKILIAVGLFLTVIFIHDPNHLFHLSILMLILLALLSGVKIRYLALFTVTILFFGMISSLYMIFYGEGTTTLLRFGIVHITEESAVRGLHIMMRGVVLSFFGALIVFTTRLTDVFYSMMQQGRLKPKFAYAFMAAIRMVPIIAGEYMTLRRARKVRRPLIHRKYISGYKGFSTTIITLLSQSIRRAYRLGIAMESKGFDDGARTYYHRTSFSVLDIIFIIVIILTVISASELGQWYSPFPTRDAR